MRSKHWAASCARCRCSAATPFVVVSGDIVTDFDYATAGQSLPRALAAGAADAHLVLVDNPPFHAHGDMGLVDGRIDPDAAERLTYANIGVFAPRLFAGLSPLRARSFPWLYAAARAGRVTGEHYAGRWHNVGTPAELARLDAELGRHGRAGTGLVESWLAVAACLPPQMMTEVIPRAPRPRARRDGGPGRWRRGAASPRPNACATAIPSIRTASTVTSGT